MHSIRLRRPWLRSRKGQTQPDRVDVPDQDPVLLAAGDTLTYQRSFNRPTGLDAASTVSLVIEGYLGDSMDISLNDETFTRVAGSGQSASPGQSASRGESTGTSEPTGPLKIDIGADLQATNRLALRIKADSSGNARLVGGVSLQIS